jgi:SAM-dependent methyltransferase
MKVFSNYAEYYDLLYNEKKHSSEVFYIQKLLKKYSPGSQVLLELGCGTGIHASLLAKLGYKIHGVDFSKNMLRYANKRRSELSEETLSRLSLSQGDIRNIRLNRKFDAIISIFHVINYLTANKELQETLQTVVDHLKPGGIFIFDSWYGPAVLSNPPTVRIKRFENDEIRVVRISEPFLHPDENVVDVKYQLFIRCKKTGTVKEINEIHRMRYLFKPEINILCNKFGLTLLDHHEWLTMKKPGIETWGVCFISKVNR